MQNAYFFTAALLALAGAAHADLKIVQNIQIDNPQITAALATMTPQQRAEATRSGGALSGMAPQNSTLYFSGTRRRADVGAITYLYNTSTHTTTIINRGSHTYATRLDKAPPAGQFQTTLKNTGQTKKIQGHAAHHYTLSATNAALPGTVIQGDIWAAQDLPQPPPLATGGPFAAMQSVVGKVKGYPLMTTIVASGSPMGDITFKSTVISVSKAPLPASLFSIPAGYKKSSLSAGPGM